MNHIMRNDPTRRFTYGMTIENTDLRMWLCHRAAVIVSEPVDFRVTKSFISVCAVKMLTYLSSRIVGR